MALGARFVAALALDDDRSVLAVASSEGDSYELAMWFAGAAVRFTTGGSGVFPPGAYWPLARLGDGAGGRLWLTLEAYGRAGNGGWAWGLTDLCITKG